MHVSRGQLRPLRKAPVRIGPPDPRELVLSFPQRAADDSENRADAGVSERVGDVDA